MKRLINRLNSYYDQASEAQKLTGVNWYAEARREAEILAHDFQLPLHKVVGVVSALSPNNKWQRNLIDARLFLASPSLQTKVCTFMGQRQKALDILQACNAGRCEEILGGTKTINFFRNILWCDHINEVTVDLWMYRAAELPSSAKNYVLITDAVRAAALSKNILPHQYQAIVWSVIRK